MQHLHWIIFAIHISLAITLLLNWDGLRPSWKRLLLGLICVISILYFVPVTLVTVHGMTDTKFCMKCHAMDKYAESLTVDDDEILASVHYRNNYVKQGQACYQCHTGYSMFGGVEAKIGGLKHMYVNYLGTVPDKIKLYKTYDPKNCLQCHGPSERFNKHKKHKTKDAPLEDILSGKVTCLTSGCHDVAHFSPGDDEEEDEKSSDDDW